MVPLIDSTSRPLPAGVELSETDEQVRDSTAALADWALRLVTRVWTIVR